MSESFKLTATLTLGFFALILFAFWPLNPYTDQAELPELQPMTLLDHPLEGETGLVINTDWNGDGADEIVTLSGKHIGIYSLHKADLRLQQIRRIESDDTAKALAAESIDWDADGDLDLIVLHSYGMALYENRAERIQPKLIVEWDIQAAWMALNDVDRDGQIEIAVSVVDQYQERTSLYNLKGEMLQLVSRDAGPIAWSDFDQDGRDELILAASDRPVSLFSYQRAHWIETLLKTGSADWSNIAMGDYDADGDQDLLLNSDGYSSNWKLLNNQSTKGQLVLRAADTGVLSRLRFVEQLLWQDINADGLLDVLAAQRQPEWAVVGCCNGVAMLQKAIGIANEGSMRASPVTNFVNANSWSATLSNASSVAAGDYNGDGLADIAAYGGSGQLRVALNQRDQNYVAVRLPQTASSLGARVTVETTGGISYTQQMRGYGNLNFGLGPHWKSKNLLVRWPNGALTIVEQPHINQRLDIQP